MQQTLTALQETKAPFCCVGGVRCGARASCRLSEQHTQTELHAETDGGMSKISARLEREAHGRIRPGCVVVL